jgi:hypothetical protein
MPDEDFNLEPELPELPVQPVTTQFPALGGDTQGEIDRRTADPGDRPGFFRRVFHIGGHGYGSDHPAHADNAAEVVADAARRGLHAKGAVELIGTDVHDEPRSQYTALTYEVAVTPAVIDYDAPSTTSTAAAAATVKTKSAKKTKG